MASPIATTTSRPDIIGINELLAGVAQGEIRVPRFQRPYVWALDDMIQLFDSVLRGYPIGSFLFWQTERKDISSTNLVGPTLVTSDGPIVKSYVVDGHQRLATLFGVLQLQEEYPRLKQEDWRWWIAYDLEKQELTHVSNRISEIPLHLLPLRSILRTVDFARRTRKIAASGNYSDQDLDELLDRADAVASAIRSYNIPLTVMRSSSLDDAVAIFARVNQRGRDMTADQMVSALTYREESEGNFDLAFVIDDALQQLKEYGFGEIGRKSVLQTILAVAGIDFSRAAYERVANRESHSLLIPSAQRATKALLMSAQFFRNVVGLKTSRLLPYTLLFVLLSIYNAELIEDKKSISDQQIKTLIRWFWGTSVNGWFAGANSTDVRQAADHMRQFAKSDGGSHVEFENFFLSRPVRPFPETFDRRSARIRSLLLVEIIDSKPLDPDSGLEIDSFEVFSNSDTRDIPYFYPNHRKPLISNPANRVILPAGYTRNARNVFVNMITENGPMTEAILRSHGISSEAETYLVLDNAEQFILEREKTLAQIERKFLSGLGLEFDDSTDRSVEEIDIEED